MSSKNKLKEFFIKVLLTYLVSTSMIGTYALLKLIIDNIM